MLVRLRFLDMISSRLALGGVWACLQVCDLFHQHSSMRVQVALVLCVDDVLLGQSWDGDDANRLSMQCTAVFFYPTRTAQ